MFAAEWIGSVMTDMTASLALWGAGFAVGYYRERKRQQGRALTEYDFYSYVATPERFAEFSLKDFRLGVHYFLRNTDQRAARQLIFIGEQNSVRSQLGEAEVRAYDKLVVKYRSPESPDDTPEFLQNYRNIARLIGRTFPNMGIEVLIHDLSNPTHSITTIESGDVTGRVVGMGTTTLLVDLMRRVNLKQDKLNYELNIGSRRFKCTTVPIVRPEFGVVGAICINIDINYIRDYVLARRSTLPSFFSTTPAPT